MPLALVTICGCGDNTAAVGAATPSSSDAAAGITRVKVVTPEVTTLRRTTTQPVTVFPYHQADIDAKVSGYVIKLNVDIGDDVRPGDVLAVVDVPEMADEIRQQEAVMTRLHAEEQQAAAAVTLAEANVKAAEASRTQAQSEIAKSDADLKARQVEFDRVQELVGRRALEARMEDEVRQRLESAQAAKSAAEAAVGASEAHVTVAEAKLQAARADVDRAAAETAIARRQMERMQTLLNYATLTAPFAGTVTARSVDLGDLVTNSQSASGHRVPLFSVGQLDRVRVQVAIPESDASWTTVGDAAFVRLSALSGRSFEGKVSRIGRSLDASTRTMLAEIDLDNPDGALLPGMYGEATIVLDEKADALVLPAVTVRFDAEGKATVYTVDDAGVVQTVEVAVGVDDGRRLEIQSGLSPEARVIEGMLDRLTPGQQVEITE